MVAMVVHGGAGRIFDGDDEERARQGCLAAAQAGYAILKAGGSALDAVQRAAEVLEDNPEFNAGTGAALNAEGVVEADALLMEGAQLRAGAVAALQRYANPIAVARRVMDQSPHVLLGGEGAAKFAAAQGLVPCDPASLMTEKSRARWERELREGVSYQPGTIGAVAVDAAGNVASATSTGGIAGKLPGRIGDTPLVGCGGYADNRLGAASATGYGEAIMRVVMCKRACDEMAAGKSAQQAAEAAVAALDRVQGEGGIIVVSPAGQIGMAFNTPRMSRAWVDADGNAGSAFT